MENAKPNAKTPSWIGAALIALAVLLGACSSSADPVEAAQDAGPEPAPAETADDAGVVDGAAEPEEEDDVIEDRGEPVSIDLEALTSRTWELRFGGGPSGTVEPVDGFPITVSFDSDGEFSGISACNGYSSTYEVNGSEIFLGDIESELVECDGPVQVAENTYIAALQDVSGINLAGDELVLSGPQTELIFGPATDAVVDTAVDEVPDPVEPDEPEEAAPEDAVVEAPDADVPDAVEAGIELPDDIAPVDEDSLTNTRWNFVGGMTPDGQIGDPSQVGPDAIISLNFFVGELSGEVVCNRYGGAADIGISGEGSVALADIAAQEEGCGDDVDDIIDAYLSALPLVTEGGFYNEMLFLIGDGIQLSFAQG